ncbi:hypothetical protein [Massilia frigida]|uniref:hypothetical protein n=1 Tax=Massilia frigida TaxID=2609281 RepID=UPI0028053F3E|nr:hypothetical protein [Massilia frigida]
MMALDPQGLAKQGMQPAALRGWIGLAGPDDFLPIENTSTQAVFHFPDTPPESQPVNHARAGTPPALLIAANNDKLVDPVRNTRAMAARLRGNGVAVQERHFDKVRCRAACHRRQHQVNAPPAHPTPRAIKRTLDLD